MPGLKITVKDFPVVCVGGSAGGFIEIYPTRLTSAAITVPFYT